MEHMEKEARYDEIEKRFGIQHQISIENENENDEVIVVEENEFDNQNYNKKQDDNIKNDTNQIKIYEKEIYLENENRNEIQNKESKAYIKNSTYNANQSSNKLRDISYEDILFFFINPIAGSNEGQLLIDMGVQKVEFVEKIKASAYIFNIMDSESYSQGISILKSYQEKFPNSLPKVIIGGGDGTTMKTIEQMKNDNINISECVFGLIPLGNGNTLSSSLGWGDKMEITSDMAKFKVIVQDFIEASSIAIDVWKLTVNVQTNFGEIIQIKHNNNQTEKIPFYNEETKAKSYSLTKTFINFFSLGFDARVGFGFDKTRTKARCCNKCIFFWEGCKKTCCRKTLKVDGFIESFNIINHESLSESQFTSSNNGEKNDKIVIFGTKSAQMNTNKYEKIVLKGNPVSLICQNINFYIGNNENIWKKSKSIGLEFEGKKELNAEEKKEKDEKEKIQFKDIIDAKQSLNDGKLEFFSYESGFKQGLESLVSGNANKIYQGKGPIYIKFKDIQTIGSNDKENRVYINIDGEYYNLVKPDDLKIRNDPGYQDSKIKFLCKKRDN